MKVLAIATVSRSLALQSPRQWSILRELGFEITFAAGEDDYSETLAELGTFVPIGLDRSPSVRSARATLRQLRAAAVSEPWDLVQLQSPIAAAYARAAIPRRRTYPLLYVVHGFHFHPDGQRLTNAAAYTAEKVLVHRTDHVAVVAEWDRAAAQRLGYRPEQTTMLPGAGVDLSAFGGTATRTGAGAVLFVGDLNQNKDPLLAIRLMVPLRRARPTATLLLVGDGPLYGQCRRLADDLGLGDAVQLVRRSEQVEGLMAESDCLISCSRREGLPRVIIEALGAGAGVVALANRGSRELLTDGVGRLMERGADEDTWVQALLAEIDGHDAAQVAARRRHAARWDIVAFERAYLDLVRRLVPGLPGFDLATGLR